MNNLWVTFSTDISGSFTELSGNIIYNLNNLYNFNGNLVNTTSNFIIYELSNNPIQSDILLQANNWKQLSLNNNLSPFQGYWLGGINTNLPQIFINPFQLKTAVISWINNPIPIVNIYGLIKNWNVQNVTNMDNIFGGETSFNEDLNNWNVGNVKSMDAMFGFATSFNGNISNWNVGNVTSMYAMFNGANTFKQDLNNWNVGNVTSMHAMFAQATSFNGNISNWNVGNVTSMYAMFAEATSFNQDISNWNVGNVTNMSNMFNGATSFNQDISNWDIGNVTDGNLNEMFRNVTFFTDMSNQIHANGTPYNYFISQKNSTPVSVGIRSYLISDYDNSTKSRLTLSEAYGDNPDSDFDRIKNALSITSMDELVNYSFTSSEDSTSADILSVHSVSNQADGIVYRYILSPNIPSRDNFIRNTPYTVTFTRRT